MKQIQKHSDQFPYLVLRAGAAAYYVIHRPADRPEKELIIDAIVLARKNKLKVCAVSGEDRCVYVEPDGTFQFSDSIPSGGILLNDLRENEVLHINSNGEQKIIMEYKGVRPPFFPDRTKSEKAGQVES